MILRDAKESVTNLTVAGCSDSVVVLQTVKITMSVFV